MTAGSPEPATLASIVDIRKAPDRKRKWNASLVTGSIILGIVALFCIVYPMTVDFSPTEPDFSQPTFAGPSWDHWLGTDNFGRDNLTRIAYGGRIDLSVATMATIVTLIVGSTVGLLSGYFGGWLDAILMRFVDFMITIPYLILVIAIVSILGTGLRSIVYAIWIIGWVTYARILRGETLVARRLEYVEAARVMGLTHLRIMYRHILPNVIGAAIVFSMADIVLNILLASSLSFLGLGTQPPDPEWGLLVAEARDFFLRDWRLMTYPGLAIMITGAGFGFLGDGLAQLLRRR